MRLSAQTVATWRHARGYPWVVITGKIAEFYMDQFVYYDTSQFCTDLKSLSVAANVNNRKAFLSREIIFWKHETFRCVCLVSPTVCCDSYCCIGSWSGWV